MNNMNGLGIKLDGIVKVFIIFRAVYSCQTIKYLPQ
jgi:hypothetical protein